VQPGALILESAMPSIVAVAKRQYPWLPVGLLCRNRFEAIAAVRQVSCAKLFVHSVDDEIVPYVLGRELYDAAPEPKQFVEIHGRHNGGQEASGAAYEQPVAEFLDQIFGAEAR